VEISQGETVRKTERERERERPAAEGEKSEKKKKKKIQKNHLIQFLGLKSCDLGI
jgi:hypothetical protein